jgi:hypothetical protein
MFNSSNFHTKQSFPQLSNQLKSGSDRPELEPSDSIQLDIILKSKENDLKRNKKQKRINSLNSIVNAERLKKRSDSCLKKGKNFFKNNPHRYLDY